MKTCPVHLKVQAYKQLVLSILEYSVPIWDPHNQTDIKKLEMVQHRATCFVLNKPWMHNNNESVTQMLEDLQWPNLQTRRKYLRLILLFKIILSIPAQYLPSPAKLISTRSHHPLKFYHYQPSNDTYRYSFFPRTIPDWNKLPLIDIDNQSLVDFKSNLSNIFL